MPYSVQSYSDVGGSPFQQYQNQQFQNYLQQQQAQQQNQQSQFGQQMPGMQPNNSPYNQQQYGQLPQYNPLPQYNFNQNQQSNQGTNFSRGFGGVETPNPIQGMYQSPQASKAGSGFWKDTGKPYPSYGNDVINMGTSNPAGYNPLPTYYSPFQYGSPSGGTGNFFQY